MNVPHLHIFIHLTHEQFHGPPVDILRDVRALLTPDDSIHVCTIDPVTRRVLESLKIQRGVTGTDGRLAGTLSTIPVEHMPWLSITGAGSSGAEVHNATREKIIAAFIAYRLTRRV